MVSMHHTRDGVARPPLMRATAMAATATEPPPTNVLIKNVVAQIGSP